MDKWPLLLSILARLFNKAGWPNGKALDYESRDCRFDPCVGQFFGLEVTILMSIFMLGSSYLRFMQIRFLGPVG